jgi:hypothetical protein
VKQKKHDNDHKGKREYETRSAMRLIRIKWMKDAKRAPVLSAPTYHEPPKWCKDWEDVNKLKKHKD